MGSSKRKSGFLSTDRLVDDKGHTIFKPCKTVAQCFKDAFTFHGQEKTRRVFIERLAVGNEQPFLRDWEPSDAMKCGIFGIFLRQPGSTAASLNDMCPGTTPSTHYCCALDMAVAPLNYLFTRMPSALDELHQACNAPDSSYPVFSAQAVRSAIARIGKYYAVPINDVQDTIQLYTAMLNDVLNEFSPPGPPQRHAKNYVQVGFFFHLHAVSAQAHIRTLTYMHTKYNAGDGLLLDALQPAANAYRMRRPIKQQHQQQQQQQQPFLHRVSRLLAAPLQPLLLLASHHAGVPVCMLAQMHLAARARALHARGDHPLQPMG
jgi:hypothetical protein